MPIKVLTALHVFLHFTRRKRSPQQQGMDFQKNYNSLCTATDKGSFLRL